VESGIKCLISFLGGELTCNSEVSEQSGLVLNGVMADLIQFLSGSYGMERISISVREEEFRKPITSNISINPCIVVHTGDGDDAIILEGIAAKVSNKEEFERVNAGYMKKYICPYSGARVTIKKDELYPLLMS